jgi:phosphocarrier protein HPr
MTERSVTVVNELGLHARAAARFVHLATRFDSQIRVGRDTRLMDGKSILGILLLAAARGTTLTISAHGADEREAVDALVQLVESGFGETATGPGGSAILDSGPASSLGPGDKWNGSPE